MELPPADFESAASTNSTTSAMLKTFLFLIINGASYYIELLLEV